MGIEVKDTNGDSAMALLLFMDLVATAVKTGNPLAKPFVEAKAITIMPDGVAIYDQPKFRAVMTHLFSTSS